MARNALIDKRVRVQGYGSKEMLMGDKA